MPWPMLERVERQEVTLHDMMERLGVDPMRLARLEGGETYARARSICLFCAASGLGAERLVRAIFRRAAALLVAGAHVTNGSIVAAMNLPRQTSAQTSRRFLRAGA